MFQAEDLEQHSRGMLTVKKASYYMMYRTRDTGERGQILIIPVKVQPQRTSAISNTSLDHETSYLRVQFSKKRIKIKSSLDLPNTVTALLLIWRLRTTLFYMRLSPCLQRSTELPSGEKVLSSFNHKTALLNTFLQREM